MAFAVFIYASYENHWFGLGLTRDMMAAAPPPQVVEGVGTVYNDGGSATVKYVTGYLVEKSLAVDNIFVIAMIFAFFAMPAMYQHRVLFWGVVSIFAGLAILATEFVWARTLLKRVKERAAGLMPEKSDPGVTHAASTAAGGSPPSPVCRP